MRARGIVNGGKEMALLEMLTDMAVPEVPSPEAVHSATWIAAIGADADVAPLASPSDKTSKKQVRRKLST